MVALTTPVDLVFCVYMYTRMTCVSVSFINALTRTDGMRCRSDSIRSRLKGAISRREDAALFHVK